MKKLILAASLLFSAATFTACNNGVYDADPNTNNSSTTVPGNLGGGTDSKFDWKGTDPFSAKVDGIAFQANDVSAISLGGVLVVSGSPSNSSQDITLYLPENVVAGGKYAFSTSTFGIYTDASNVLYAANAAQGGSGGIKILETDESHVKGLFYFTAKNPNGTTKTITEGYFNAPKK